MPKESQLWTVVRRTLLPYGILKRIENILEDGTPDVAYTLRGVDGWLELKDLDAWPAREGTVVRLDHYTAAQRLWHRQWRGVGGRCHVLARVRGHGVEYGDDLDILRVRTDDELFLFDADESAVALGVSWTRENWTQHAVWSATGRFDGRALLGALTRPLRAL
jgi:hypothetical protein